MTSAAPIARALEAALGGRWSVHALGASGFCSTWRAEAYGAALFVKSLPPAQADVLEAEAGGLAALAATGTVRVPRVVHSGRVAGAAVLALEWLDLREPDAGFGTRFGRALGALHRAAPRQGNGRFGWHRDNLLGATPQRNRWSGRDGLEGWIEFFGRERLGAMRDRLAARGVSAALTQAVDRVIDRLPALFADGHVPRACLIHGDLWSGNWGMLADGTPIIYDPAVSYSDAEAELAMMELFGELPRGFRQAYGEQMSGHQGYVRRRGLYQLYHLLNHALLFGGGYVQQSLQLARTLATA
ncbi:MAG TPA: fructosamine kinase family protein [Burkholderiaceae bacterium]|nr:fructosamine kinase family protein [Burkholderiaceae bacterium]